MKFLRCAALAGVMASAAGPPPPRPLLPPSLGLLDASAGAEEGRVSALEALQAQTVPPSFWSWQTTPGPPTPPGPSPQLIWVEQTAPPLPTTPPMPDQCYGCDCLFLFPGNFLSGGNIADKFTCRGSSGEVHVPEFTWAGEPQNSGQGHPLTGADGSSCARFKSYAITMDDLDYPNGIGESTNEVRNSFWAVNIPGDWNEFNEQLAHSTYKDKNVVTIGRNGFGNLGMEVPCPRKGTHRFQVTLWVLDNYLGSELEPVDPDSSPDAIRSMLQAHELARASFYGTVLAVQPAARSFLERPIA